MMGCPSDRKYIDDCLRLWGLELRNFGTKGFPSQSAFVPRARGVSVEWTSDLETVIAIVVGRKLDVEQRDIVTTYYKPQSDIRRNGEYHQCNMTLTLEKIKKYQEGVDRNRVNKALDYTIGMVSEALSYPTTVWIALQNEEFVNELEKKVCNF